MAESNPTRGGNLLSLGISQLFRIGSGLAINVLMMRGLGVDGFGILGYLTTLVGLVGFGANLGMDRLLTREMARQPEQTPRLVSVGLLATAALSLTTGLLLLAWVVLVDGRPLVIAAAALAAVALGLRSLALVPVAAFTAMRRMGLGTRGDVAGRSALVLGTALFLWLGWDLVSIFAGQVLDGLLVLGTVLFLYRRVQGPITLRAPRGELVTLARRALPFGLNGLFGSIYLSVDVLMLTWMQGESEVGIYRGAVMLIALFPIVANMLTNGLYPRMARHLGDPAAAGAELRFLCRVLLALSLPVAVGGLFTARPLMVLLGGEAFAPSALPFMVMAPLLPLRFLNNGYAMTLSALDHQEDRTRGVLFAAIFNVAMNLYAIPRWGATGAAATTLLTEIWLSFWMAWRARALATGIGAAGSLVRVGIPAGIMALALWLMPQMPVLLTVGIGGLVYAASGLVTGAWHPRDLSRLRRI